MRVITTIAEIEHERQSWRTGKRAGLVPTMGYLHAGHLALIQQARVENDVLIVSIFVNPTQFAPGEDFARYPRDMQRDLHMLEEAGVDLVFAPTAEEIYPAGFATYVDVTGALTTEAEGAYRPGHFRGVATVVLKLFQLVQAERAYFGQKDAQQVAVIQRMVRDFNLPIVLHIQPTVREADGLALSSRNTYLDSQARRAAAVLYQTLQKGKQAFVAGEETEPFLRLLHESIEHNTLVKPEYVDLRDPYAFHRLPILRAPALLLIAAQVGQTRLIDNFLLREDGTWETGIILPAAERKMQQYAG